MEITSPFLTAKWRYPPASILEKTGHWSGKPDITVKLYTPDSLMRVIPRLGKPKVAFSDLCIIHLSSSSTWLPIASFVLLYPSASATSLPTNQGTSSTIMERTCPNLGCPNNIIGVVTGANAVEGEAGV